MSDARNCRFDEVLEFGPFRLYPGTRRLEKNGQPFALGNRALDLLISLAEHAGEVVDKRTLIARTWRDGAVDDSNLRVNIASLRKALGNAVDGGHYVSNIPGRGYCFVARVSRRRVAPTAGEGAATAAGPVQCGLPPMPVRLSGREQVVASLGASLNQRRLLSIVGPGGSGKSCVAVAVGHEAFWTFERRVHYLDLTVVAGEGARLPRTLCRLLDLAEPKGDPCVALAGYFAGHRSLLILDNCEHLADAVAALSEQLIGACPELHLLLTSREALRSEGEWVYPLPPLACSPGHVDTEQALAYPALRLFVEQAQSTGSDLVLDDASVALIGDICRRLEGLPLAINIAARRVGTLGLQRLAELLGDVASLDWQGRRTAPARQRSLRASLDWSHGLIAEDARRVFVQLAAFDGGFSLDDALRAVGQDTPEQPLQVEVLERLVAASLLVVAPTAQGQVSYRMSESSRVYALSLARDAAAGARRFDLAR
ncbi:ATP-binding protein [Pseudomonas sp. NPDC090202]|uniref:ATP-binding protein n=1 Tax=unclassified Pseudomonas TaxID=196821 RepID=UPI0038149E51